MMDPRLDAGQDYKDTIRREKFKATAIWNDLVDDLHRHIVVKKRRWKMKTYENCFPGSDAITVLKNHVTQHPDLRQTVSRAQLRSLCQIFIQKRIIESVDGLLDFEDSNKLYRFVDMPFSKAGPQMQEDIYRDKALLPLKKEISIREVDILRREISVVRLLQLIEIPVLESLLESFESYANDEDDMLLISNLEIEGSSHMARHQLDQTLEMCNSDNEKTWLKATIDCFNVQTKYPLKRKTEIGFRNSWNDSILGLSRTLSDYYCSIVETLFPQSVMDVVKEISRLLECGKFDIALRCLQLLIILLPINRAVHLQKLLQFMYLSIGNNICPVGGVTPHVGVISKFMDAVVPECEQLSKKSRYYLVSFMLEAQCHLFDIPKDVLAYLKEALNTFEQGRSDLPVVSPCCRITVFEYEQQKKLSTKKEIERLINQILDDLHMSLKEKKQLLKAIQKHHPDSFYSQFPDGEI